MADGTPVEVLMPGLLATVFGVHAHITTDPASHTPVGLPCANVEEAAPVAMPKGAA